MTLHLGRPDHLHSMVASRPELDIQLRIARAKNGYRAGRVIGATLTIGALLFFPSEIRAKDSLDRLTRIARTSIIAESSQYNRLLEKKLFVTSNDIARYLYLTNGRDGDRALALHQAVGKKGTMPGNFWITATVASAPIPYAVRGEPAPDIKSVTVQRYDAPLPSSTAKVVQDLWLAMLERSQPEAAIQIAPTVVFSARSPSGNKLRAAAGSLEKNSISLEMMLLGEDLINYSQLPSSKRQKLAHEIEKHCSRLLKRVLEIR